MNQTVAIDDLREFVVAAFSSTGLEQASAAIAAEALVSTDSMGVFTHGTKLLQAI